MKDIIVKHQESASVAFAHSISADFDHDRHMTAGVAVIFKQQCGKPSDLNCVSSHLAYQNHRHGAGIYSLITKPKYYNKPKKTDYDLAFHQLAMDFERRGFKHLICSPIGACYLLADQGYDVWMGNPRGNIYSKAHETLHPDDPNFWNWTWDEMGRYDLPAVIGYILQVTGHQQILYIGHSMGTTMFFVLCSSRPEYNAKVLYMAALAPVAYMGHTTSPLRYLAPYAQSFENLLPMILGHVPAGATTKTLVHYAQEIKSNQFQRYDYGAERNIILYNSTTPPLYNLSKVSVPVSLHYGDNDLLARPMVSILSCRYKEEYIESGSDRSLFSSDGQEEYQPDLT
ncbi:lipase 1-like [Homalodisca vitripennis]|uniref:lipase 1-like n=1 Tax=Homalodisca vitripennis TaxID=197043 RepID=UPI001EEA97AD|nr:lipase 1-like [Homalodisca vitripennis]